MMKKCCLFLGFLIIYSGLMASEVDHSVGFIAGKLSGIGLNYRSYKNNSAFQFTVGMYADNSKKPSFSNSQYASYPSTKTGWNVDGWIGFALFRILKESEESKFYVFGGGSVNLDIKKKYIKENYDAAVTTKKQDDSVYYLGAGMGIDFHVSDYVSLILEIPLVFGSDKSIESYIPQAGVSVHF